MIFVSRILPDRLLSGFMAKPLVWSLNDQTFPAELGAKVSKKDLYGYAKTYRERAGKPLSRGYLKPDGRLLVSGTISSVKADPMGTPVEDPVVELQGQPAEKLPSSFDRTNPLTPVPMTQLIGFCVRDAYPLSGLTLAEGLYSTSFSYRSSFGYSDAYILARPNESWLFVGIRKESALVGQVVIYEFFDAESEDDSAEDEELDFAMV